MRLIWAQEAMDDRDAIFDFIEENNQIAALALDELFSEKVSRLLDHPNLDRPGRMAGTREWVVHQNYIVIYDVTGDVLRECCVWFTRRDDGRRPSPRRAQ